MDGNTVTAFRQLVEDARKDVPGSAPSGRSGQDPLPRPAPAPIEQLDLALAPCDPSLISAVPADIAITLSVVPHMRMAGRLVVATARPDLHREIETALAPAPLLIAQAPPAQIADAIRHLYGPRLARIAETRAPEEASARVWTGHALGLWLAAPVVLTVLCALIAPTPTLLAVFAVALLIFLCNSGLKIAALAATLRHPPADTAPQGPAVLHREPVITILVPLFKETNVAQAILARLTALEYPRDKLDVIFVLEACDTTTQEALKRCTLPCWARALIVPDGSPQTKPRALNYALPFARGTVLGIYDAEDAPEPDQLAKIAARFAAAPPDVACLQGQLDYYNSGHNLVSRCFTMEYASWFRLILPGVARLGLAVPLGGTTLFIKRDALTQVGAWDAHNVTEDAELGIRLARHGYRTELIQTTTFEEANSAVWPWVRQRTRWLKGYAITWATVMRRPRKLRQELGWKRFIGLQVQLAGAVLGFATAPILWSLALVPLGLPHPVTDTLPPALTGWVVTGFTAATVLTLAITWLGCRSLHLQRHRLWAPVMLIYYPLATIAALWALAELAVKPFYWAKTEHGQFGGGDHRPEAPTDAN